MPDRCGMRSATAGAEVERPLIVRRPASRHSSAKKKPAEMKRLIDQKWKRRGAKCAVGVFYLTSCAPLGRSVIDRRSAVRPRVRAEKVRTPGSSRERSIFPGIEPLLSSGGNDHGRQPPMEKTRIPASPRLREKQTDEPDHRENWRKTGYKSLLCNLRIPGDRFYSNPAGAEEVMRIKLLCYLMRVPVPDRGW